jgi:DNA-binding transcriptional ArsR family regulator
MTAPTPRSAVEWRELARTRFLASIGRPTPIPRRRTSRHGRPPRGGGRTGPAVLLSATFAALADPTRRAILERLTAGDVAVTELARPFRMSLPAVSKHLRVLETAGLIARDREGRVHRMRLVARPMKDAVEWMAAYAWFWDEQLQSLGRYLESNQKEE